MKLLAGIFAAAALQVAAQPHRHAHRHAPQGVVKREPDSVTNVVYVPGPVVTVVRYELNGHEISEAEVRQGIANGTFTWGDDGVLSSSAPPVAELAQATPAPEEPEMQPQPNQDPVPSEAPPENTQPVETPSLTPSAQPEAAAPSSSPGSYQPVDQDGNCPDCDKPFPNGTISCDSFPTGYGAVHLSNEGLGGWTGIQDPVDTGANGFDNIMTVPKGSCDDGTCCTSGRFCSYACPNPYLKMSFPRKQGATGQSVGGLYCNNAGKLEMADGSIGNTLCGKGSSHMKVKVQNKLSKPVSICRTDYPGTESETIPLTVQPGQTGELANPDQSAYYFWQNAPTSAHYYINKQGVPESEACTWNSQSNGAVGNWAPLIFGTSFDDLRQHMGYTSLKQNELIWNDRADFTATFTGDGVTNPCKFVGSTGEFCSDGNCGHDVNCTAAVNDGSTLTLVFTDD